MYGLVVVLQYIPHWLLVYRTYVTMGRYHYFHNNIIID